MAKKKIIPPKPASKSLDKISQWAEEADESKPLSPTPAQPQNKADKTDWGNKPYSEKDYKGRSISMSNDFYAQIKDFTKAHPELGTVSQMTVRALFEFMQRYRTGA